MPNEKPGLIILAAGSSRRYGKDKLLESLEKKRILQTVLDNNSATACDPKILVIRPDFPINLFDTTDYQIAINRSHEFGISTSIITGLKSIIRYRVPGVFLVLGDMPFVRESDITYLWEKAKEKPDYFISFTFKGKKGFPTYIPEKYFDSLMKLEGDSGAFNIVKNGIAPFLGFEGEKRHIIDIDSENDLKEYEDYDQGFGALEKI